MSKLPRTRDLPEVEEGYDPARVEEAFATFAERVQELESVASELRSRTSPASRAIASRSIRVARAATAGASSGSIPSAAIRRRRQTEWFPSGA